MALPTPVNGQITDAVTQANLSVLGKAPAMAMGTIYQAQANAIANLFTGMSGEENLLALMTSLKAVEGTS